MEIPYLIEGQFAVGKAELATGIVLNNDGTFYKSNSGEKNTYEIFDNYIKAEKFAKEKITIHPNIECWIVDSKGNHLITFDKEGERK